MLKSDVLQYLIDRRQQHLGSLCELLSIPSVANVNDGSCHRAAQWLADYLAGMGASVRIAETASHPNVMAFFRTEADRPTLLIYGHYDVQPPDPLEQWTSPPFTPAVRDGCLYARGASDNKGQLFTHLMAVEAWQRAGGGLPLNVKFFIEGEEEIGSPHLEDFLAGCKDELAADAAVISDSEFFADGIPAITYSLRGLAYVEITVAGPASDVHSGIHGGPVRNPINALAAIIAAMHDSRGRVTLEGFYDDVLPLSRSERRAWAALPFDEKEYARSLGVAELSGGEGKFPPLERRWSRPALDCNGIIGGYTGAGPKTIIPAAVKAKVSLRLVPNQELTKVIESVRRFVSAHTPPGLRSSVEVLSSSRPVLLRRDTAAMKAATTALAEAFGREPTMIRCGASVPAVEYLQRLLGLDAVLMGLGLPDDGLHGPNEHFRLDQLWRGSHAAAAFFQILANTP